MTNKISKLALNKVEELEKLLHRKKTPEVTTSVIKKDSLTRNDISVEGSFIDSYTYKTKLMKLGLGENVIHFHLVIENLLKDSNGDAVASQTEDKFTVTLSYNGEEICRKTKDTLIYMAEFDCFCTKYIFDSPNVFEVTISHEKQIQYTLHDFYFEFAKQDLIFTQDNIITHERAISLNNVENAYQGSSVALIDGVDMNGVYNKKYAFSEVDRANMTGYIYEQDVSDFCLSKAPVVLTVPNLESYSTLSIGYNCMKNDDGSIVYRHLVGHYTRSDSLMANVNQQRTGVLSKFDVSDKIIYTAHQHAEKKVYSYVLIKSNNKICFGDAITNAFVGDYSKISYETIKNKYDFQDACIPLTRNLNDVYKKMYPFVIFDKKLYMLRDGETTLVPIAGAPTGIYKIAGMSYVSADGYDLDVFLTIGDYTYKYRFCLDLTTDTYYINTAFNPVNVGYGIVQFQPLYDNDAFIVTQTDAYFTKEMDKIWL